MPGRTKQPRRAPLAMRLGVSVRSARVAKKLTQELLAERAGLSKNYVGNIERGEYDVTVGTLKRVADAVGCSGADLLSAAGI